LKTLPQQIFELNLRLLREFQDVFSGIRGLFAMIFWYAILSCGALFWFLFVFPKYQNSLIEVNTSRSGKAGAFPSKCGRDYSPFQRAKSSILR
jgi:hypothetical protein